MKKRICYIISVLIVIIVLGITVVQSNILYLAGRTPYPDAVTEMNGITMDLIGEPTAEQICYRIINDSGSTVYTGDWFALEYYFLGGWHRLRLRENSTFNLNQWIINSPGETEFSDNLSLYYIKLPHGKYRLVKRIETAEIRTYEDRDKYFILSLAFTY